MANNWAIAVGINQYEFFQPLAYAQADAEALRDFLVKEAGFLPEYCLLLTDTSPPIGGQSTYPNRDNLLRLIDKLPTGQLQPEDRLWFFFSGYGVYYEDQDYLMPIEGNPAHVLDTGIPVRSLFESLQAAAIKTVLVLLDTNRMGGTGLETVELAQELAIPTVLSCLPDQFSHESAALGHSFFTAALIEALRSGQCGTLAELEHYLSARLPELCRQHWRPVQDPVIEVQSPETSERITLPHLGVTAPDRNSPKLEQPATPVNKIKSEAPANSSALSYQPTKVDSGTQTPTPPSKSKRTEVTKIPFWQPLLWWAGGIAVLAALMMGVLLRNKPGLLGQQAIAPPFAAGDNTVSPTAPNSVAPTPPPEASRIQPRQLSRPQPQQNSQQVLNRAKLLIKDNQASAFSDAIDQARKIQPNDSLHQRAQQDIDRWSRVIMDMAQGRAGQGNFNAAIAAAALVSEGQVVYPEAQRSIQQWRVAAKQQQSNRTLLQAATGLIRTGQASSYNQAIEVASKIPPAQPVSAQAQQSINQWSQTILALATKRANQGNLNNAIQTAALVPESTAAYSQAQQAIQKWQQTTKP